MIHSRTKAYTTFQMKWKALFWLCVLHAVVGFEIVRNSTRHAFHFVGLNTRDLKMQLENIYQSERDMEFVWIHSKYNFVNNSMYYYPKQSMSKKCLLVPYHVDHVKGIQYTGNWILEDVLGFIQMHCKKYRNKFGKLSKLGKVIRNMESSLYELESKSKCSYVDGSTLTPELFFNEYVAKQRPVIITNSAQIEWPNTYQWSKEYLKSKVGDKRVHVKVSPNGIFEGIENVEQWSANTPYVPPEVSKQLAFPELLLVRPAALDISFDQFLKHLETTSNTVSMYLEYLSIASYFPSFVVDTPVFKWATFLDLKIRNLWYGDGRTIGKLHFDAYENLMTMIAGQKKFILFDPSDNQRLYEGHIREAIYDFDPSTFTFRKDTLLESTSMVNSPIELFNINTTKYPKFNNTPSMECNVKENQTLYLPAFWWHEVISKPSEIENRNVAVNFWFSPLFDKEFPCTTCQRTFNTDYLSFLRDIVYQTNA